MQIMGKDVAKTWNFESDSTPGKVYETIQYCDGSTSCNCKGWTQRKPGPDGLRTCNHTRRVDSGVADQSCVGTPQVYGSLTGGKKTTQYVVPSKAPAGKGKTVKVPAKPVTRKFDFSGDDKPKPADGNARKIVW